MDGEGSNLSLAWQQYWQKGIEQKINILIKERTVLNSDGVCIFICRLKLLFCQTVAGFLCWITRKLNIKFVRKTHGVVDFHVIGLFIVTFLFPKTSDWEIVQSHCSQFHRQRNDLRMSAVGNHGRLRGADVAEVWYFPPSVEPLQLQTLAAGFLPINQAVNAETRLMCSKYFLESGFYCMQGQRE